MEVLSHGILTEANFETVIERSGAREIVTPDGPGEGPDFEMDRWFLLRDHDGVRRLYLGNEATFGRYVAACTGVM